MNPNRVAVFIDNSNVYKRLNELRTTNKGNWAVCLYDPLKLAKKLAGDRNLVGTFFYCSPPPVHMLATADGKKVMRYKRVIIRLFKNCPT